MQSWKAVIDIRATNPTDLTAEIKQATNKWNKFNAQHSTTYHLRWDYEAPGKLDVTISNKEPSKNCPEPIKMEDPPLPAVFLFIHSLISWRANKETHCLCKHTTTSLHDNHWMLVYRSMETSSMQSGSTVLHHTYAHGSVSRRRRFCKKRRREGRRSKTSSFWS